MGKLSKVRQWKMNEVTYEGELVVHEGSTYQALKDTGSKPGTTPDWIGLAIGGKDGQDARSPTVRNTYNAKEKYSALDIVMSDGAAFIARCDNPGVLPGDGWKMISRQGSRGISGEKGERGPKGDPGPAGVSAPLIKGWRVDRKSYTAVPVMSDGKDGPALELRSLFKQFQDETR